MAVELVGGRQLRAALRRAGDDLSDLKEANIRIGRIVAERAHATAPRRTGALAASLRSSRAASKATVYAGGARLRYAGPIHWGWPKHNITANPFISKAAQDTESLWVDDYTKQVQRLLDRAAASTR